ncbi:hypothetical protein CLUG_05350 [Clavispora lusitaniae ATCC 42720]|uniref:Uncharacterized protein n=1 Tax=Clavispora lusitaniae (strain ATCC 42720) TaxID=306902 RepID=C4YB58_CLAL4|nr:uncharacterized protein CLUG_05350 [Clavispora lusitaniae ATCC 42720]EEQ41222.1 hypothetical protein CLUG_05350 [Clavispora lusitaniae ATCC 42720]
MLVSLLYELVNVNLLQSHMACQRNGLLVLVLVSDFVQCGQRTPSQDRWSQFKWSNPARNRFEVLPQRHKLVHHVLNTDVAQVVSEFVFNKSVVVQFHLGFVALLVGRHDASSLVEKITHRSQRWGAHHNIRSHKLQCGNHGLRQLDENTHVRFGQAQHFEHGFSLLRNGHISVQVFCADNKHELRGDLLAGRHRSSCFVLENVVQSFRFHGIGSASDHQLFCSEKLVSCNQAFSGFFLVSFSQSLLLSDSLSVGIFPLPQKHLRVGV